MRYLKEMSHVVLLEDGEIIVQGEIGILLERSEEFAKFVKIDSFEEENEEMNGEIETKTVK